MNMKKKLVYGGATAALAVALVAGGGAAAVKAAANDSASGPTSIITKLAQKFGLKEADVKAVFDEEFAARKADMEVKAQERLTKLVTDGKITEAQKQLIVAKQQELEAARATEMESLKDKTPEERKALMDQKRTELESWAKTNGIDLRYLMPMGHGMGGRGGHGGMSKAGNK